MYLDFLSSADGTPLTKSFARRADGEYDVTPYPHIRLFTSERVEVTTLEDMTKQLQRYASRGFCLLKGLLREPLVNTSRAGMTDPTQTTEWLALDLDFSEGWDSVDAFLADVDPILPRCSHIIQKSASAGIRGAGAMRCHIFFRITPILPTILKMWLRSRNLGVAGLAAQAELSASGATLKWPLDITVNQNDKLIYIAPPECINFDDPLANERIVFEQREFEFVPQLRTLEGLRAAAVDEAQKVLLDALREAAELPKMKPRYREVRGQEYLVNPDKATVTGMRTARGFTYVNLNGGDSWAYYFPEDNPEFVFNFKGEPVVRLRDIAPDLFHEIRAQVVRDKRAARDFQPVVFHDWRRDTYVTLKHFGEEARVDYAAVSTVKKLNDFMLTNGETPPESIDDWEVEFDPTTTEVIDMSRRWLNTFDPTPYILMPHVDEPVASIPPTISRVIHSICVDDEEVIDHFLNWLAFIFQTRRKSGTAWIFHGISGTGKGVLLSNILRPIFGHDHVIEITAQTLEDQFNALVERALFVFIDEFQHESARSSGLVMNKLKNLITEEQIIIRQMRTDAVSVANYSNVIIATNHPDPIMLPAHDRRFNVAPPQERQLYLSFAELDAIRDELVPFVAFLQQYKVRGSDTRRILLNDARDNMIVASQTTVERMFEALRLQDLRYFTNYLMAKSPLYDTGVYPIYELVVMGWVDAALKKTEMTVTRQEILSAYHYIMGAPTAPSKLDRMLALYRVPYGDEGVLINWQFDADEHARFLALRAQKSKPHMELIRNDKRPIERSDSESER